MFISGLKNIIDDMNFKQQISVNWPKNSEMGILYKDKQEYLLMFTAIQLISSTTFFKGNILKFKWQLPIFLKPAPLPPKVKTSEIILLSFIGILYWPSTSKHFQCNFLWIIQIHFLATIFTSSNNVRPYHLSLSNCNCLQ